MGRVGLVERLVFYRGCAVRPDPPELEPLLELDPELEPDPEELPLWDPPLVEDVPFDEEAPFDEPLTALVCVVTRV